MPVWATAAVILITVGIASLVFWPGDQGQDRGQADPPAVAAGWKVVPTGSATYSVVSPYHLKLDRGELLVQSTAANDKKTAFIVETRFGVTRAKGTKF